MSNISQQASQTPILILDGGLGTSLQDKYQVPFNADTPLWSSHLLLSLSGCSTLRKAHADFLSVPVDILSTATYQTSIRGFAQTRSVERFPEGVPRSEIPGFLEFAINIADGVRRPSHAAKIAFSLGPYGASMVPSTEYSGAYDADHDNAAKLMEWHDERLGLVGRRTIVGRADYIAFETVPRVDEIVAIRSAMDLMWMNNQEESRRWEKRPPFWISCVFPGDGVELPDGSSVQEAVKAALVPFRDPLACEATPCAIGINCTKIAKLSRLVDLFERAVQAMMEEGAVKNAPGLVLYPDGTNGEVYNTTTQTWEIPEGQCEPEVPWEKQFAEIVKSASSRGRWAFIIAGGCCKANSEDIRRLRSLLKPGNGDTVG